MEFPAVEGVGVHTKSAAVEQWFPILASAPLAHGFFCLSSNLRQLVLPWTGTSPWRCHCASFESQLPIPIESVLPELIRHLPDACWNRQGGPGEGAGPGPGGGGPLGWHSDSSC